MDDMFTAKFAELFDFKLTAVCFFVPLRCIITVLAFGAA